MSHDLRERIQRGDFGEHDRLPTEAELERTYGVSRQTIRRAFQDLVAEGLVHRVPGRGTFPVSAKPRYARPVGSIDELMEWNDSDMVIAEPMTLRSDPKMASRLELSSPVVAVLGVERLVEGLPFAATEVFLSPSLAQRLVEDDALKDGSRTVLRAVADYLPTPLGGVQQTITATTASAEIAERLGIDAGQAVLRAERMFFDSDEAPVEVSVTHYHPDRYAYRLEIRGRVDGDSPAHGVPSAAEGPPIS